MTIDSGYIGESFVPVTSDNGEYQFTFESVWTSAVHVTYLYNDDTLYELASSEYSFVRGGDGPIFDGGTVTIGAAAPGTVTTVIISRSTNITQNIDFQPYTAFPSETNEFGLDKLTMICQEISFIAKAALNLAESGDGGGGTPTVGNYIPLAGTLAGKPVTGTVEFNPPGANGPLTLSYASNIIGQADALWFNAQGDSTGFFFSTKSSAGVVNTFAFGAEGNLIIPSTDGGNNEVWSIGADTVLGVPNTLIFAAQDELGVQTDHNIAFSLGTGMAIVMNRADGGYMTLPRTTAPGDPDLAAVTKDYVDAAIPPGGGEANTTSNEGAGVGLALDKAAANLPFKTIIAGTDIEITEQADTVTINSSGGGGTDYIPLSGTVLGTPVTGQVIFDDPDAGIQLNESTPIAFGGEPGAHQAAVAWLPEFATLAFLAEQTMGSVGYSFQVYDGTTTRNFGMNQDGSMKLGKPEIDYASDNSVLTLGWWKDDVLNADSVSFGGDINAAQFQSTGNIISSGSFTAKFGQYYLNQPQGTAANTLTRRDFVTGLDAGNVKTTGTQSISGAKTFTQSLAVQGTLNAYTVASVVGNVTSASQVIIGASTPTASNMATRKSYVDANVAAVQAELDATKAELASLKTVLAAAGFAV